MLEDNAAAVDWSIDQLLHSGITQNQTVISGTEADFHLQQMVNRQSPETGIVVKVQVLRSHCGEFLEAIQAATLHHETLDDATTAGHLPRVLQADDPKSFQTLSVIKQLAHQHQGIVTFPATQLAARRSPTLGRTAR